MSFNVHKVGNLRAVIQAFLAVCIVWCIECSGKEVKCINKNRYIVVDDLITGPEHQNYAYTLKSLNNF